MFTHKQILRLSDPHRMADHIVIKTQPWSQDITNCTRQQIDTMQKVLKLNKEQQKNWYIDDTDRLCNMQYKNHKYYRKHTTGTNKGKFVTGYCRHFK